MLYISIYHKITDGNLSSSVIYIGLWVYSHIVDSFIKHAYKYVEYFSRVSHSYIICVRISKPNRINIRTGVLLHNS